MRKSPDKIRVSFACEGSASERPTRSENISIRRLRLAEKKGAFVPRYKIEQSAEREAWEAARERLLREDSSNTGLSPEIAEKLKSVSYEDFETLYFAGAAEPAGTAGQARGVNIGGQTIFVDHVGSSR